MKKHKRLFAALLVLAVAIVMLSSAVYIAVQADHDCTGPDCQLSHCKLSADAQAGSIDRKRSRGCRCRDLCPVRRVAVPGEAVCLVYTGLAEGKTIQLNTGMCLGVKSAYLG